MNLRFLTLAILILVSSCKKETITQIVQAPSTQGQNELQSVQKIKISQDIELPENSVVSRFWYKSNYCDLGYDFVRDKVQTIENGSEIVLFQGSFKGYDKFRVIYSAQVKNTRSLREVNCQLKSEDLIEEDLQTLLNNIFKGKAERPFFVHYEEEEEYDQLVYFNFPGQTINVRLGEQTTLSAYGGKLSSSCTINVSSKAIWDEPLPAGRVRLPKSNFIIEIKKSNKLREYPIDDDRIVYSFSGFINMVNAQMVEGDFFLLRSPIECSINVKEEEEKGLSTILEEYFSLLRSS